MWGMKLNERLSRCVRAVALGIVGMLLAMLVVYSLQGARVLGVVSWAVIAATVPLLPSAAFMPKKLSSVLVYLIAWSCGLVVAGSPGWSGTYREEYCNLVALTSTSVLVAGFLIVNVCGIDGA